MRVREYGGKGTAPYPPASSAMYRAIANVCRFWMLNINVLLTGHIIYLTKLSISVSDLTWDPPCSILKAFIV